MKRKITPVGWVVLALLLDVAVSVAGDVSEIRFERLGSESGLSHNSVFAILQDRSGFLWIGTQDGLNRYDGSSFRVYRYSPKDPASISSNRVEALLEDRARNLWVATSTGLDRFDRGELRFLHYEFTDPDESPVGVFSLLEDRSGAVWAGAANGLYRYDTKEDRWHHESDLAAGDREPPSSVFDLDVDSEGNLWALAYQMSGRRTLWKLSSEGAELEAFAIGPEWGGIWAFVIDSEDEIWLDASGRARFDREEGKVKGPNDRLSGDEESWKKRVTSAAYRGSDGTLWIASPENDGVFRLDPETGERFLHDIPDASANVLAGYVAVITEDRSGTLWFGTENGLYRKDPHSKPFEYYAHDPADVETMAPGPVSAISVDSSGALWVGTFGGGLSWREAGRRGFEIYQSSAGSSPGLGQGAVRSLHIGSDAVWVGTDALCQKDLRARTWICHDVGSSTIQMIEEDGHGILWLATEGGLVRFDPGTNAHRFLAYAGELGRPESSDFISLLSEGDEALWAGTWGGALKRFDSTRETFEVIRRIDETGWEQASPIFQVLLDRSGFLWLATGDGLSRYDRRSGIFRHLTQGDGLPGSNVFSMLEDDRRQLWLGTNRGLSRFNDRFPPDRKFRNFDLGDGIGNFEFNRHAAWKGPDGRFYFGGTNGLTVFRPNEILGNPYVPPMALTEIRTWSRSGVRAVNPFGLDRLTLTHEESTISIEFAALSFTSPQRNLYEFKLEGFERSWISGGNRGYARYTNLPAGRYSFRARGSNNDRLWNQAGLSLPILVLPPFWQTWWFELAAVLAAVGLLAVAYRLRIGRLLALQRMRLRIASDLHDELGSELSGISLTTEQVACSAALSEVDRKRLNEVQTASRKVIQGLGDIVWYVNPEHDRLESMISRMRSAARTHLGSIEYEFQTNIREVGVSVDMDWRRQIFLSFKEMLTNVARHSRASNAWIYLHQKNGVLVMEVRDDGVGFDPEEATEGTGIKSLRRRAQLMDAKLAITSRPGRGTRVRVEIPI